MGSFYLPTLVILYTYASIIYVVQTRNREFKEVSKWGLVRFTQPLLDSRNLFCIHATYEPFF